MKRHPNIAIDGPAGAGKSTAARLLAAKLGFIYIDTGAMYRAVTLKALMDKINMADELAIVQMTEDAKLEFKTDETGNTRLFLDDRDVTEAIRTPQVANHVSLVSRIPGVRHKMSSLQRAMASRGGVVMEGRDIGTHVLPDAEAKFYLTASVEERARRRHEELKQRGYEIELSEVMRDIRQRDEIDTNRSLAPLKPALDAEIIDCSAFCADQVIEPLLAGVSGRIE
ncbi:MAG: (d)CMP kinase [Desulfotomaculaceae bacterium]